MNFKSLTAVAAITVASVSPVQASYDEVFESHQHMWNLAYDVGDRLEINPAECDAPGETAAGWYRGSEKLIVICQENRQAHNEQVEWTAYDLNTMRHEVHHLVQDCMTGEVNGHLEPVYRDPIGLAHQELDSDTIMWLKDNYRNDSHHVAVLEHEAWAVAEMNDPREQARDIEKYCM